MYWTSGANAEFSTARPKLRRSTALLLADTLDEDPGVRFGGDGAVAVVLVGRGVASGMGASTGLTAAVRRAAEAGAGRGFLRR